MSEEAAIERTRAPITLHLIELRRRLMVAATAWLLAFGVCYCFAQEIYGFLVRPLAASFEHPETRRLIYTGLIEAFFTYVKLAAFAGFFLAFPVIAGQLYSFLAPGLYQRERQAIVPYLVAAPLLFLAGAALAYYGIFPVAWKFFLSFESSGGVAGMPITLEARVSEYLGLVMQLLIVFGLAFQLPVVLTLMARFGMVRSATLAKGRRYAVVIIVIVAGFVTPPDILSQIALSIPLYLLYECSIFFCRLIENRREEDNGLMVTE